MATPPVAGGPVMNPEGPAAVAPTPGTDMTGICFKDQLWLNTYPLDRNLVFDYFALSPFYDWTCNNEQLRMRSIHPLDLTHLSKMTGTEYMLYEVMEPHLFVIRKQKRDGPEKVTPMLTYYILDGSIYQAPQLCNVFAARISRSLYHISKAFTIAASKLEKIGYVDADESAAVESKVAKETIDFKEVKRVDHILASLQRKLPPAPPPPPFPEGYVPPASADTEKAPEVQQSGEVQPPPVDPIIDQGPAKRMKI
ncbi:hypothetical protein RGQ29_028810 [Quercus rubra]|uniref:Mediator of RNA polymerase II transcription subunit 6 n=1 Tax=Quercus rubra TaxID=3512 RepID=A0AAN7IME5_QUERU|nr:hypothetical protein RGQ29_028810 [Quercus rubra]